MISVDLVNEKLKFSGTTNSLPEIPIDYPPPLSDGEGYTSMELLLISLASCTASVVVSLLRKMRKELISFNVSASGTKKLTHPMSFTHIILQFNLHSNNTTEEELLKVITLSEEKYCPVWDMLKSNVKIEFNINLIKD